MGNVRVLEDLIRGSKGENSTDLQSVWVRTQSNRTETVKSGGNILLITFVAKVCDMNCQNLQHRGVEHPIPTSLIESSTTKHVEKLSFTTEKGEKFCFARKELKEQQPKQEGLESEVVKAENQNPMHELNRITKKRTTQR
ncbi:hypothetical protein Tco_0448792 [Tanacetum coccineum]